MGDPPSWLIWIVAIYIALIPIVGFYLSFIKKDDDQQKKAPKVQ